MTTTITWPSTLPPWNLDGYSLAPGNRALQTDFGAAVRRRRIYTRLRAKVAASLELDAAQEATFWDFFEDDLDAGTLRFLGPALLYGQLVTAEMEFVDNEPTVAPVAPVDFSRLACALLVKVLPPGSATQIPVQWDVATGNGNAFSEGNTHVTYPTVGSMPSGNGAQGANKTLSTDGAWYWELKVRGGAGAFGSNDSPRAGIFSGDDHPRVTRYAEVEGTPVSYAGGGFHVANDGRYQVALKINGSTKTLWVGSGDVWPWGTPGVGVGIDVSYMATPITPYVTLANNDPGAGETIDEATIYSTDDSFAGTKPAGFQALALAP